MEDSSKKSNLSFSFNLDNTAISEVHNESSTDSETAGLQIDVSEVESFNVTGKMIRQDLDDTSFLNEMEEEIERQLDAKAAKTKLTATNVKNILKHVISNEHVMAMVHTKLTKGGTDITFEPKLTRAKAKELALAQPDIPWPMTPGKPTTSQAQILIEKEYSEDSSDEEYRPDQDQQSDEEKDVDSSTGNDIDSLPSTPATPADLSNFSDVPETSEIQYDEEGVFKVPPNVPQEDESIGHRTRSKLCLSETPLEQIEQAFIPPDITTDMYDWDWEPEDEYIHFLKDLYTQPLPKEVNIEDDPEADPEYNILEDEETELLDTEEELREDRAVKIPKRELKTLIAELDEFADQYTKQQEQEKQKQQEQQEQILQQQKITKKKKTPDSSFVSAGNTSLGDHMIELLPVLAEPELPQLVNSDQRRLLTVQISQHVQLMAQQFVMTYKHPTLHQYSKICKSNLNSLLTLGDGSSSEFFAQNLNDALKLVSDWESKLVDSDFLEEYTKCLEYQMEAENSAKKIKRKYKCKFHPELIKLMANSRALMHPQLLPSIFPNSKSVGKIPYLPSEESLIALGLEQFKPYFKSLPKKFNRDCDIFADSVGEIQKYLLPIRDTIGMIHHIKRQKGSKKMNPIKYYYIYGTAPNIEHCILSKYELLSPIEQSREFLPKIWQFFVDNLDNLEFEEALAAKPQKEHEYNFDDNDLPVSYDEIEIHREHAIMSHELRNPMVSHELRNPIINMMHMPSLFTPQKDDAQQSPSSSKTNSSTKIKTLLPSKQACETVESDAESAESMRTCETDEEESRPTRLRMTTPRLAKIKSAQNMKLLAQTLSPKGSISSSSIGDNKEESPEKNDDDASSFSKGDNEDEIAELMLASTTIKKNATSRKKTKQARELENLKRLVEAENNINEEERATKFAASFIQKIHVKLESQDPELFKTLFKIFLDFGEKMDNPIDAYEDYFQTKPFASNGKNHEDTEKKIEEIRERLSLDLYREVCEKLCDYPDLCSDFLLFLTPQQAASVDKSVEHTMMLKMKEFINVTQMYFAKQPSRIAKVMQAITQMASDPYITLENAQTIMGTALKGHPLIMDMFLQVLPTGKPPDSLFAAHMFENLACPVGPHDKNKIYEADAPELYENIELPVSTPQEDPYGGDSCKCECHSLGDDSKLKGLNEHCASCGTRFLNGRIYLQTSEGLRPAKITFPGADDEKLENISRVSLKTTERIIPCPPARKRRKSSKGDSISEEPNVKPCTSKSSPAKENEEIDRSKSKKVIKSPPKTTDTKKLVKVQPGSVKTKREKKAEKKIKIELKTDDDQNEYCTSTDQTEFEEGIGSNTNEDDAEDLFGSKLGEISTDSHEDDTSTSPEKTNPSSSSATIRKLEATSDSDSSTTTEIEKSLTNAQWTMQDDKILLEHVQRDYSEKTFVTISLILKNRTVEQVKERCQYLLSLIEKMG